MQLQEDYQVTLDAFHGPLDLLLYLIRRAEVDIHDIPIAQITDQYLAFLRGLHDIDIDVAGEFLVMAATLIEIKSRALAPAPKPGEAGSESGSETAGSGVSSNEREFGGAVDPRFELVQALLAYQRYRIASEELEARRRQFLRRFPLLPHKRRKRTDRLDTDDAAAEATDHAVREDSSPPQLPELELDDVHVLDLQQAYEHIASTIDFTRLGEHRVEMDDTPIALYEEDLLDRLERTHAHRLRLQDAFEGATRPQRIGYFMATLELTRLRRIVVSQNDIDADIEILLNDDPDDVLVIESDEITKHSRAPHPLADSQD